MNNKYTHIFFDLDNTLWDFEKNSRNAMFITFGHFKLNLLSNLTCFLKLIPNTITRFGKVIATMKLAKGI